MPKYVLKSFLAGFFSVTFTFSPFAMATSQSEINKFKTFFQSYPTNGKTYAEFYTDIAKKNPKANQLFLKQLARMFGSEKMPKTQIQEFKYKGQPALKMIVQNGKQSIVIEILNNGNEMLKIDGVVFSKLDVSNHQAFNQRLKQVPSVAKLYTDRMKKAFSHSHKPTPEQWARLSPAQRAEYYMRFRLLLEAAYKVHNTPGFKVVNSNTKSFEQWVQEAFLGHEAQADAAIVGGTGRKGATPPGKTTVTGTAREAEAVEKSEALSKVIQYNKGAAFRDHTEAGGPSCIVAGYAMEWNRSNFTCPWNGGKKNEEFYNKYPISKECQKHGATHIACNPVIYGFNESGEPHCINSSDKSTFNFATHGDGPCEAKSPLRTADDKMKFIQNILKRGKIPGGDQLEVKVVDGNRVLYSKDPSLHQKIMDELKNPLLEYINSAEKICEATATDANGKKSNYKYKDEARVKVRIKPGNDRAYQDKACDGLMQRALAVENLLQIEPQVQIAKACDGWGPEGSFEEVPGANGTAATCKCKNGKAAVDKCCPPSDEKPKPSDPIAKEDTVPEEPVAANPGGLAKDAADCSSMWNRMSFAGSCTWSASDIFWTGVVVVGGACAINMGADTELLWGICNDDDDNDPRPPTGYDPVPTPVNPTDPTTPTDPGPVNPPRENTNQTIPKIDQQIPPR